MRATLDGPGNEDVNLYVASFSEQSDSLSQWRAYGGTSSGFSLGFAASQLSLPERFKIARCIYEENKQRSIANALVDEVLQSVPPIAAEASNQQLAEVYLRVSLLSGLHRLALAFKHPKFSEEREWRVIPDVRMDKAPAYPVPGEPKLEFREGRSMLVPYHRVALRDTQGNFPLSEIVVGPNPNPKQSERSAQSLLDSDRDLARVRVRSSDVPYRNW
jgi:hypothetical protein